MNRLPRSIKIGRRVFRDASEAEEGSRPVAVAMGMARTRWRSRCIVALLVLIAATAACSSTGPSAPSVTSGTALSESPRPTSPVESGVAGGNSNTAQYSNSLVGLRFRYDAAEMVVYDDPVTLESNGLTEGSQAALKLGYMGDSGAAMWIIVTATPKHARKSPRRLAGFAATLALMIDDSAKAQLRKGSIARYLGVRRIGGQRAFVIERRGLVKRGTYKGSPDRYRSFGLATEKHAFILIQEVGPARFASRFNAFDRVLKTVRIGDQ